jgi:HPt (histidine-containing phosphotransfer) domain-containing protein
LTAHTLKSAAASLGLLQLSRDCARLEARARAGRLEGALKTIAALRQGFERVRPALLAERQASGEASADVA